MGVGVDARLDPKHHWGGGPFGCRKGVQGPQFGEVVRHDPAHPVLQGQGQLLHRLVVAVYRVGAVKTIPGVRTYVSVDGGMTDNPRYALYQADYTFMAAAKAGEPKTQAVTVAGRCWFNLWTHSMAYLLIRADCAMSFLL